MNGRRKTLQSLTYYSWSLSFSFSLVILKRAPSSVQCLGSLCHLLWIPSKFPGCLTISKSCQKAQSSLHTLIRCSCSFLSPFFPLFCSWIIFLVPTHSHSSNSGSSNLSDAVTAQSSNCPTLQLKEPACLHTQKEKLF